MMASKARVFGDDEVLKEILSVVSPHDAKKLGRKVRNFDEAVWKAHRLNAVIDGNMYKFSQNEALRHYLVGTGQQVLVEASPYDRIWGIGMTAQDKAACEPGRWKGLNLLGFALMSVRESLL